MQIPDFSKRSTISELMDSPDIPAPDLYQNLKELEQVNSLLGGYDVVLDALQKLHWPASSKLRILDVGSGGGDTLRAIAKWARKTHQKLVLTGLDLNPIMTKYAVAHSNSFPEISFLTENVFSQNMQEDYSDIVTCSLFCHHFKDAELILLLQRLKHLAARLVIINDLHRHWLAWHSIRILTQIFSKSYLVKNDAPLSVARALTRKEWVTILNQAGIDDYTIRWRWAWRWQIVFKK